jgi:hypothetical protein
MSHSFGWFRSASAGVREEHPESSSHDESRQLPFPPTSSDGFKGHFPGRTLSSPLPSKKELAIGFPEVTPAINAQPVCGAIDPSRGPLEFDKVSDWGLVQDSVPFAICPLGPEFLISKSWRVTQSTQNGFHLEAIGNFGLPLDSRFVAPVLSRAFRFMGQYPVRSIFSKPQQFAVFSQIEPSDVIQTIHLAGSFCNQSKSRFPQTRGECAGMVDFYLDFDFLGHS